MRHTGGQVVEPAMSDFRSGGVRVVKRAAVTMSVGLRGRLLALDLREATVILGSGRPPVGEHYRSQDLESLDLDRTLAGGREISPLIGCRPR